MAKAINAQIVADSVNIQGDRITTYVLTYPRIIHAEVMTHRMFSRNAASSRAIPFERMLKMVIDEPFIPIAWQKDHKGMQGNEYFTDPNDIAILTSDWLTAAHGAAGRAKALSLHGVTKQICNRLLEPFLWYTALVTTTEYDNFFDLRCPKYQIYAGPEDTEEYLCSGKSWKDLMKSNGGLAGDFDTQDVIERLQYSKSAAEIHIQALAEAMWDARNESEPRKLKAGEWHIPFGDQMDKHELHKLACNYVNKLEEGNNNFMSGASTTYDYPYIENKMAIKIAIARCARLSYMTFEGEINYQKDVELFDILHKNKHMSPFEHVARCMSDNEYSQFSKFYPASLSELKLHPSLEIIEDGICNNIKGFVQYRFFLEKQ